MRILGIDPGYATTGFALIEVILADLADGYLMHGDDHRLLLCFGMEIADKYAPIFNLAVYARSMTNPFVWIVGI